MGFKFSFGERIRKSTIIKGNPLELELKGLVPYFLMEISI